MRFRLCGDLDVPDWVLKEISAVSKIVCLLNVFLIVVSSINSCAIV